LEFFYRNLLGIVASNGEALVMGLAVPSFYRILAFSGQTSRKRDALPRKVANLPVTVPKYFKIKVKKKNILNTVYVKLVVFSHSLLAFDLSPLTVSIYGASNILNPTGNPHGLRMKRSILF
jgi:hypothetical protein